MGWFVEASCGRIRELSLEGLADWRLHYVGSVASESLVDSTSTPSAGGFMSIFEGLAEIVENTQSLIDRGWRFKYEPCNYCPKIIATKGDEIRHGYDVEGFLAELLQEELREYELRMLEWFKQGAVCPTCKNAPPINTYSCSCGWAL